MARKGFCVVSGLTLKMLLGRDPFILTVLFCSVLLSPVLPRLGSSGNKTCSCCSRRKYSPPNHAHSMISQIWGNTCSINYCCVTSYIIRLSPQFCTSHIAGGFYSKRCWYPQQPEQIFVQVTSVEIALSPPVVMNGCIWCEDIRWYFIYPQRGGLQQHHAKEQKGWKRKMV